MWWLGEGLALPGWRGRGAGDCLERTYSPLFGDHFFEDVLGSRRKGNPTLATRRREASQKTAGRGQEYDHSHRKAQRPL